MIHIAVLITCHNRRDLTLRAIRCASAAAAQRSVKLSFFITDDGSTDGTSPAVIAEFPDAVVQNGPGNLFWNGGMRAAWKAALEANPDFYLWLNDDLALSEGSLSDLLSSYERHAAVSKKTIVVGYTIHPTTGEVTYGGLRRASKISRLRFKNLSADDTYCHTMNGNCVLIPASAVHDIGISSERYTHSFGDMDYGLRANHAGYKIVQTTSPVGFQERSGSYTSPRSLSLRELYLFVSHPKGMPFREWLHFCRLHGGFIWPINFLAMYLKPFIQPILRRT